MRRSTALSVLTLSFVAAFGLLGVAPSASADDLCYAASTAGTVPGSHTTGPICYRGYPYDVACGWEGAGLAPTAAVRVEYCTP